MGDFKRIDPPDVQPNAKFILDGLNMPKEMFVTRGQNTEHSKMWGLQECQQVSPDITAFCFDVIGDNDVVDTHLPAHAANIAARQICDHGPVIGVGHWTEA